MDRALLQQRFTAGLAAFAAAITGLLACMGVYGLLAYSVTARVREIGVRVALGASRATLVWMIVRDGLAVAVPGVLIGAPCAWAAARLVRAQLYGIAARVHGVRNRTCSCVRGVGAHVDDFSTIGLRVETRR